MWLDLNLGLCASESPSPDADAVLRLGTLGLWADAAARWRPRTTRDHGDGGWCDGAAQKWAAPAGDAGAEIGGGDGRSWRCRGGRAAATAGAGRTGV